MLSPGTTNSNRHKVKIRNADTIKVPQLKKQKQTQKNPFSSEDQSRENEKADQYLKIVEKSLKPNENVRKQNKKENKTLLTLEQMKVKLEKISSQILESQYGPTIAQNPSYIGLPNQIRTSITFDNLAHRYTLILLQIIKTEQQTLSKSSSLIKTITIKKDQRTRLKLILSAQEQIQQGNFQSRGIESYMKRLQEQSQKHKRQLARIRERNRMLEGEMLKVGLQFKSKRELYISEITRLTDILNCSFMQVGKMLMDPSSTNVTGQSAAFHNGHSVAIQKESLSVPSGNNPTRLSRYPDESPYNNFSKRVFGNEEKGWDQNSLNRKNIRSLSPPRRNQHYTSNQTIDQEVESRISPDRNDNYLKLPSANSMKRKLDYRNTEN